METKKYAVSILMKKIDIHSDKVVTNDKLKIEFVNAVSFDEAIGKAVVSSLVTGYCISAFMAKEIEFEAIEKENTDLKKKLQWHIDNQSSRPSQ